VTHLNGTRIVCWTPYRLRNRTALGARGISRVITFLAETDVLEKFTLGADCSSIEFIHDKDLLLFKSFETRLLRGKRMSCAQQNLQFFHHISVIPE
jgi:hypothetical protein